jgi:hypothetical protein
MFNAVRRRAARLAVVASAAALAAGPAVAAHAQPPITATVIVQSIDRPEDVAAGTGEPLAGVTVQATNAAGDIEDQCVTDANGRCTLEFTSEGTYSVCITDVPDIYDRESTGCVTSTIRAGTSNILLFFLAPAEENGNGDGNDGNGNGNGDNGDVNEDEVTNSGDHDNINTGSGQNCSVTTTNNTLLSVLSPTIVNCVNAPARIAS